MDFVKLALRDARKRQVAHGFGAVRRPLADGFGLNVHLLPDELLEWRDALLLSGKTGQRLEVAGKLRHLFYEATIGFQIGFVARDEVAAMAAFRRNQRFFDGPEQLDEFMA